MCAAAQVSAKIVPAAEEAGFCFSEMAVVQNQANDILDFVNKCFKQFGITYLLGKRPATEVAQKDLKKAINSLLPLKLPSLLYQKVALEKKENFIFLQALQSVVYFLHDYSKCFEELRRNNVPSEKINLDLLREAFNKQREENKRRKLFDNPQEADATLLSDLLILLRGGNQWYKFTECEEKEAEVKKKEAEEAAKKKVAEVAVNVAASFGVVAIDHLCNTEQLCLLIQRLITLSLPKREYTNLVDVDPCSVNTLKPYIEWLIYSVIRIPDLSGYLKGIKSCARSGTSLSIHLITESIVKSTLESAVDPYKISTFYLFRQILFEKKNGKWKFSSPIVDNKPKAAPEMPSKTKIIASKPLPAPSLELDTVTPADVELEAVSPADKAVNTTIQRIDEIAHKILVFTHLFMGHLGDTFYNGLKESLILLLNEPLFFKLLTHDILANITEGVALSILETTQFEEVKKPPGVIDILSHSLPLTGGASTDPLTPLPRISSAHKEKAQALVKTWSEPLFNTVSATYPEEAKNIFTFVRELSSRIIQDYVYFPGMDPSKKTVKLAHSQIKNTIELYIDSFLGDLILSPSSLIGIEEEFFLANALINASVFFSDYSKALLELKSKGLVSENALFLQIILNGMLEKKPFPFSNDLELDKAISDVLKNIVFNTLILLEKRGEKKIQDLLKSLTTPKERESFIEGLAHAISGTGVVLIDRLLSPENIMNFIARISTEDIQWSFSPSQESTAKNKAPTPPNPKVNYANLYNSLMLSIDSIAQSLIPLGATSAFSERLLKALKALIPSWKEMGAAEIINGCNNVLLSPYRESVFLILNLLLYYKEDGKWKPVTSKPPTDLTANTVRQLLQTKLANLIKEEVGKKNKFAKAITGGIVDEYSKKWVEEIFFLLKPKIMKILVWHLLNGCNNSVIGLCKHVKA